ncbi:MAG: GIY-YIG nuclease family protein [Proteobacteria bacterium]|nr:GIY-YIG nuclease family protein [Pseudomonadota bacterium]
MTVIYKNVRIKKVFDKTYCVYMLTNKVNTVLYTGVTNNLVKRVYQHKNKLVEDFTKRYNVDKLVYYEVFNSIENAIIREKQIKAGSKNKKLTLINAKNPKMLDLYETII